MLWPRRCDSSFHVCPPSVDRQTLVGGLLAPVHNFVGEPSNTLLRREHVDIETVYTYAGGLEAKRVLLKLERGSVPAGGWQRSRS